MSRGKVVARRSVDALGRSVVEFSGLEHLHPDDRPPRRIVENVAEANRMHRDTSATRKPVKQELPGRPIEELRDRHAGEPLAIWHNGPSLPSPEDLARLPCASIGMNRTHAGWPTWAGPDPTYLAYVDDCWSARPSVRAHPRLVDGSFHRDCAPHAWRATRSARMYPFSFDLARDGFVGQVPCTTGFLALQLAVFMGAREVYLLGLDLSGPHFDGTPASDRMLTRDPSASLSRGADYHYDQIAPVLAAAGVQVFLCGSPESRCRSFPHVPLSALLERARSVA